MALIGYIVGKTTSGKSVLSSGEISPNAINREELFDTYAIFQYLSFREYIRDKHSEAFDQYLLNSESLEDQIDVEEIARIRSKHHIRNAFELRDYGRQLVLPEFSNLDRH